MEGLVREKSWSVKLVTGRVLHNQVRAVHCAQCQNTCDLMVENRSNPSLALFGCSASKCQHKLIRMDFSSDPQ